MDVHVVMASDANYLVPATVAMHGALENGSASNTYTFHLITPAELELGGSPLVAALRARHPNFRLDQVRVTPELQERFEAIVAGTYLAASSCYRLAIGELLPELDRCVYLDCDVCVQGDLATLWQEDLQGCSIGAVRDPLCGLDGAFAKRHQRLLGFPYDMRYFCAGVMLMDLARMRALGLLDRLAAAPPQATLFGDQDVLNTLLRDDVRLLPLRYDVLVKERASGLLRSCGCYAREELDEVDAGGAVVLHYAGPEDKPWRYLQLRVSTPWLRQAQDILPAQELAGVWRRWRELWDGLDEGRLVDRCRKADRVLVQGFTRHGRACAELLAANGVRVEALTDNDAECWGSRMLGIECVSPQGADLARPGTLVVVASQVNHAQAMTELERHGARRGSMVRFFNFADEGYRAGLRPEFAGGSWPEGEVPA